MKNIRLNDIDYVIEKDEYEIFNLEEVKDLITDYFNDFDYIFGDYSYGKLRLKGYNDKTNKKYSKINDIETINDYIENYCAYGAKWFLLKKVK